MGLGAWGTKATAEPTMATRAVAERTRMARLGVCGGVWWGVWKGGKKLGNAAMDGWTA